MCVIVFILKILINLLPTGSEERELLGVVSIHVAVLTSCQDKKTKALYLHEHEYSWVVKNKKHLRGGPHTASYMFLMSVFISFLSLCNCVPF